MVSPNSPAGWYPDPMNAGQMRYWDGGAWTEQVSAPAAPPPPPPGQPTPSPPVDGNDDAKTKAIGCVTLLILVIAVGALAAAAGIFDADADPATSPTLPAVGEPMDPQLGWAQTYGDDVATSLDQIGGSMLLIGAMGDSGATDRAVMDVCVEAEMLALAWQGSAAYRASTAQRDWVAVVDTSVEIFRSCRLGDVDAAMLALVEGQIHLDRFAAWLDGVVAGL